MILSTIESKIGIIIVIFLFYLIFSDLLVSLGKMILSKSFRNYFSILNRHIIESFSFFLGILLSSSFIICLSYFVGLELSFYLFAISIICLIIIKGKLKSLFYINYKKLIIILIIVFLQFIIALIPLPSFFAYLSLENLNPFDGFGSIVHSLRSGNISLYLLESNTVPRVNQNIGQSLITTYPMFVIGKFPQINLIVWKSFVVYHTLNMLYGMVINFTSDLKLIIFAITATFFGQTGFGITYIQTLDTGSSLFFLANTDTFVCIFSFLVFYMIALYDLKVPNIYTKVLLVLIGVSWNFFGSQNILLALVVFFGFLMFYKKINYLFCFIFFIISLLFGYMFGGLFAVDTTFSISKIPGLMSVINDSKLLEFRYPILSTFTHFEFYNIFQEEIQIFEKNHYYKLFIIFMTSLFSVLIGFFSLFYLLKTLRKRNIVDEINFSYIFIIITFIGIVFSSTLKIYGQVWELSRFYYIGNYFIIISMSFVYINMNILNLKSKYFIFILYLFSFVPVLFYSIFFIHNNLFGNTFSLHTYSNSHEYFILSVSERFDCLFRFNTLVGKNTLWH
jgi:hypothetical protein